MIVYDRRELSERKKGKGVCVCQCVCVCVYIYIYIYIIGSALQSRVEEYAGCAALPEYRKARPEYPLYSGLPSVGREAPSLITP